MAYRVQVTWVHVNETTFSVIEDAPNAPRYDGTYEEARELIAQINKGTYPRYIEESSDHWVQRIDGTPVMMLTIVEAP